MERLALDDVGFGDRPSAKNTVVCYDSPNGFQVTVGHAKVFKKTLIVHSPSGNLNNTLKADGVLPRFFPVPTEAELEALGVIEGIDADLVRQRVALYGPIIRYVFNTVVAEKCVRTGISKLVGKGVDGLAQVDSAPREVHRIMLMLLKPDGIDDMYTFASDHIRDQVVRGLAERHAVNLLQLANTVDLHGSLRGQVFESRMLDTLGRAGAEIKFKASAGDKVFTIAGNSVVLCVVDKKLALPAGESALRHNVLYRPPHSNNASWDAAIVENDSTAYLLQMTVSTSHPVKRHGLVAGKALLEAIGFKGDVQLVFLVPPAVFERFSVPQSILNDDNTASATAAHWMQDKWQVLAVDGVAFWPR